MSITVKEYIIRLDVSVYVAKLVEGMDSKHHFCDVEPGHLFWKSVFKLGQ